MARKSILKRERKELRSWYLQQHPRPSHRQCINWFEEKFKQKLSQATISKSLSHRYSYLDESPATSMSETGCRTRPSKWPVLEQILYEWQQSVEAHQNGSATITSDILIAKAIEIWRQIPQYRDQPQPHFSSGWLTNYKARHHHLRKQLRRHDASPGSSSSLQPQHQICQSEDSNLPSKSIGNQEITTGSFDLLTPNDIVDPVEDISFPSCETSNNTRPTLPEIRIPTPPEALKALQTYLLFKAYQDDARPIELRSLIQQEQQLQLAIENAGKQSTLDNWLTNHS